MSKMENGFLTSFVELEPLVYLPFERALGFPAGVEKHGKLYTVDGIQGEGMRFDDGFLTLPCPSLEEGFSMMCWVCTDNRGKEKEGIIASWDSDSIRISSEHVRIRAKGMDSIYAVKTAKNWVFIAFYMDKKNGKAGLSVNFQEFDNWDMEDAMAFSEDGILYIGQDENADKKNRLAAVLDDFCLCRKILSEDDLRKLKTYYGGLY